MTTRRSCLYDDGSSLTDGASSAALISTMARLFVTRLDNGTGWERKYKMSLSLFPIKVATFDTHLYR